MNSELGFTKIKKDHTQGGGEVWSYLYFITKVNNLQCLIEKINKSNLN